MDAVENELPDGGQFEKFGLRQKINTLLLQLWRLPDARATLCAAAAAEDDSGARRVVGGLAHAMLDTLLYQLEEALKRIRECNLAAFDSGPKQLEQNQGYCKHLLEGSMSTLELMGTLTGAAEFGAVFATGPVAHRTAAASLQFLTKLCGKHALDMKLRGGRFTNADFGFDPIGLLRGLCGLLLGCVSHAAAHRESLVAALASHDDLELPVLRKLLQIVQREHLLPLPDQRRLAELVSAVEARATQLGLGGGGGAAAAGASSSGAASSEAALGDDPSPILALLATELGAPAPPPVAASATLADAAAAAASILGQRQRAKMRGAVEERAYTEALEEIVFDQARPSSTPSVSVLSAHDLRRWLPSYRPLPHSP